MENKILSDFFGKPLSPQILESITPELRLRLINHAMALSEISNTWKEKLPTKTFLSNLLGKFHLKVSPSILNRISEEDEFEIWALDGQFMASSNKFFKLTSWSIEDLLTKDRSKLFYREEKYMAQGIHSMTMIASGAPIVENPTEPHVVRELKEDPVSIFVKIDFLAPVYKEFTEEIVGILCIVNFKQFDQ